MALRAVTLDDKYSLEGGGFTSRYPGAGALPMMQRQRDILAGLNTGCFISGYRGHLWWFDQALWNARRSSSGATFTFNRRSRGARGNGGLGSQQINLFPDSKYDGVFALWYAKAPG